MALTLDIIFIAGAIASIIGVVLTLLIWLWVRDGLIIQDYETYRQHHEAIMAKKDPELAEWIDQRTIRAHKRRNWIDRLLRLKLRR